MYINEITTETLKEYKSTEKFPITCTYCNSTFDRLVNSIRINLKEGRTSAYCSPACGMRHKRDIEGKSKIQVECAECKSPVMKYPKEIEDSTNVFCCRSCSAKFTNRLRSPESRKKQGETLKETIKNFSPEKQLYWQDNILSLTRYGEDNPKWKGGKDRPKKPKQKNNVSKIIPSNKCVICSADSQRRKTCSIECLTILKKNIVRKRTKITTCHICNSSFEYEKHRPKTCSPECYTINHSRNGTNSLRKRRLRGEDFTFRNPSSLEAIFIKFLDDKKVKNYTEVYVRNPKGTFYRLDFIIPHKKLIVEVDGKQHTKPKQKAHDVIRDQHMLERGWRTIRINHIDIHKPEVLEEIYERELK